MLFFSRSCGCFVLCRAGCGFDAGMPLPGCTIFCCRKVFFCTRTQSCCNYNVQTVPALLRISAALFVMLKKYTSSYEY